MPVLELSLQPGESIISEVGEFSWMTDTIQISTGSGGMGGSGLKGMVKRAVSGSTFLLSTYTAEGGLGAVSFAAKVPGHIVPIDVTPESEYLVHRHGFMAATPEVTVGVGFQQSFKGGVFGGMGFILQKISGTGRAFIELSGEVLAFDLQPGQSMRVHPGHVGLLQASVTFQVVRVPGLMNRYMGDDGHHFAVLTGPGRIWLQSMPLAILAGALQPFLGDEHPAAAGAAGGAAAGMLGNILR
jgi:uncharacterized protein (AIM24 family)